MAAKLLKGKKLSDRLRAELKARAEAVTESRGAPPGLAILSIGGDPASQIFLRNKLQACKEVGVEATVEALHAAISEAEVQRILAALAENPAVDGIILDLPLPEHLDARRLTEAIASDRDVEGVTTANYGRLYTVKSFAALRDSQALLPCTANAVIRLLLETGVDPRGLDAVVVGRSNIVGRPTAHLLSCLDATVTLCHARTRDLAAHLRRADILVSAAGKPRFIRGGALKPGAVVLDAGMNGEGAGLCGDVDFDSAVKVAGHLTPVPGGIGPLTVTCLLENTVLAAERRTRRQLH